MKFTKIFASAIMLAGLASLASCSKDEPLPGGDGNQTEADSYIHIRIANVGDITTRSETGESGTASERKIANLSFYFFDSTGEPFKMENNNINGTLEPSNRVKPVNMVQDANSGTIASTLVLGKAVNSGWLGLVPTRMVAVANLSTDETAYNDLANLSMSELREKIVNAKGSRPNLGEFVMTCPTYLGSDPNDGNAQKLIYWSPIAAENVSTTPEGAVAKPVIVYLERLAAKVTVVNHADSEKFDETKGLFKVQQRIISDAGGNTQTKQFYAKVLGWDLNATAKSSYLIKTVDPDNVPFLNWNLPDQHRSCWALSYNLPAQDDKMNPGFINRAFRWENLSNKFGEVDYCLENTSQPVIGRVQDAGTTATKVLLKAQITDESGTPLDLVSWAGVLYSLDDFKTIVLKHVKEQNPNLDDESLLASKITFKRNGAGNMHKVSTYFDDVKVDAFDNIRFWDNGVCYYIINIRHAVNNENVYGVVRNHYYKVGITAISGLGTPGGNDPHDYPENPDKELESFVAAEVQILDWHVVSYDVEVGS